MVRAGGSRIGPDPDTLEVPCASFSTPETGVTAGTVTLSAAGATPGCMARGGRRCLNRVGSVSDGANTPNYNFCFRSPDGATVRIHLCVARGHPGRVCARACRTAALVRLSALARAPPSALAAYQTANGRDAAGSTETE